MDQISETRVIDENDVAAARAFKDEIRVAKDNWLAIQRGIVRTGAAAGLPALNDILNGPNVNRPIPQHKPGSDFLNRISFGIFGDDGSESSPPPRPTSAAEAAEESASRSAGAIRAEQRLAQELLHRPPVVNNYYTVNPTPRQIEEGAWRFQYNNGDRVTR